MTPRALIIASSAGMGHTVRMRALAAELVEAHAWGVSIFDRMPATPSGKVSGYDVVIIDSYTEPAEAHEQACPTVAIVDHADRDYPVDLLVNGGAGARPEMYTQARRILAGPQYALLRREFREWAWDTGKRNGVFDARWAYGMSAHVLACHMAHAAMTVTYGGMRSLEAASIGAPMVIVEQNDAQALNVEKLQACGAAIESFEAEALEDGWAYFQQDPDDLPAMSAAGRALVDGRGCERVALAITELVK